MNKLNLIPIGKIIKPHGIKGELKFSLYNKESKTLVKDIVVWFKVDDKFKNYKLNFIRGSKNSFILKLDKINNIDQTSFLKNKELYISRKDFPELDVASYYVNDLIGLKVLDKNKKNLGVIIDILNFPSHDILLVKFNNKEIMIPNVRDFIELFDFEKKIIIVKNIKSLI